MQITKLSSKLFRLWVGLQGRPLTKLEMRQMYRECRRWALMADC